MSTGSVQNNGQQAGFDLNQYAENLLTAYGNTAVKVDNTVNEYSNSWSDAIFEGSVKLSDVDETMWDVKLGRDSKFLGIPKKYLAEYSPSWLRPGALSETFSLAGKLADTMTGVVSVGKALNSDMKAGDRSLKGTMIEISKAVGKNALTFGTASVVSGAIAVAGAPILVPAVLGVGAGVAAGYVFDQAADVLSKVDLKGSLQNLASKLTFW